MSIAYYSCGNCNRISYWCYCFCVLSFLLVKFFTPEWCITSYSCDDYFCGNYSWKLSLPLVTREYLPEYLCPFPDSRYTCIYILYSTLRMYVYSIHTCRYYRASMMSHSCSLYCTYYFWYLWITTSYMTPIALSLFFAYILLKYHIVPSLFTYSSSCIYESWNLG